MARKPNPFKGVSIDDLLSIDIETLNTLNTKELSRIISRMSSVANKRLVRLEKAGFKRGDESDGVNIISGTRKFGAKGKSLNQLRTEFHRARNFLEGKTSTVRGMREVRNDMYKRISDYSDIDIQEVKDFFSGSDYSDEGTELTNGQRFWRVVKQLENSNRFQQSGYSSSQIQGLVMRVMTNRPNMSLIEAINLLEERATYSYEENEEIEAEYEEANFITL